MSDVSKLMYGPIYYGFGWTMVGILFALLAAGLVFLIFFITRKKTLKSLSTLKIQQPKIVDLNALKQKYLGLIDQAERNYSDHKIKASVAHQHFSLIVRLFYCEAVGFHAEVMSLRDLKRSNYTKLIETIENLYPDEFDTLEKGSVKTAAEKARKLVEDM